MTCAGVIVLFTAILSFLVVVFSASAIHPISLVNRNVTVDNVNETLSLGTLGYCLTAGSNGTNVTCSSPKWPGAYVIDNPEVLAQVKLGTVITKTISIANPMALIAVVLALIFAFWSESLWIARLCSSFGALSAVIGVAFEIAFITNIQGIGFGVSIFTSYTILVLGCFSIFGRGEGSPQARGGNMRGGPPGLSLEDLMGPDLMEPDVKGTGLKGANVKGTPANLKGKDVKEKEKTSKEKKKDLKALLEAEKKKKEEVTEDDIKQVRTVVESVKFLGGGDGKDLFTMLADIKL